MKSVTVSVVSLSICHEVMGPNALILVFLMLSFTSTFSLSSFTLIKRLFSSSLLSAVRVVSSLYPIYKGNQALFLFQAFLDILACLFVFNLFLLVGG